MWQWHITYVSIELAALTSELNTLHPWYEQVSHSLVAKVTDLQRTL